MNKLKTFLIILLLILLTFSFLKIPEFLLEKSNLRILETKEKLTYNYTNETISSAQLAQLFCSGELENHFSFIDKSFEENINEASVREKADFLLKNLFKYEYSSLYGALSDITSGIIADYNERNVFIANSKGKPIALNFIIISFMKDHNTLNIFFEEKTQTVLLMEYAPQNTIESETYEDILSTSIKLNEFFRNYFSSVLKTRYYDVHISTQKDIYVYCLNTLIEETQKEY